MNSMTAHLLIPALLLSVVTLRGEDAKVDIKYIVGSAAKYTFEMKLVVQGMDVTLKASPTLKVKSADAKKVVISHEFSDIKLAIGENEQDVKIEPLEVEKKPNGELLKVTGGIDQISPSDLYLLMHFIPPTKATAEKEEYKVEFAKTGDIPAYSFSAVFEGAEKVNGMDTYRFASTLAAKGEAKISSTSKFWVTSTGSIVKAAIKFKNLDIPPAGGPQEGTISLTLSSK